MNKKIKYLAQFLLLFCLSLDIHLLNADALFDDLFKGMDMDQFLKDLEAESEKEPTIAPTKPSSSESDTKDVETTIITSTPSTKPQTRDELFITPVVQTIQEKGRQSRTVPTSSSIKAFKEVMNELVTLANEIQIKVNGSSIFSLPFKEQFSPYWQTIDKIAIAYGTMVSKKLYATIIPFKQAPEEKKEKETKEPKETKKPQSKELETLRQNILDVIKELENLDQEIGDTIAREETNTSSDAALEELAKKSRELIKFNEAPIVSKRAKAKDKHKKIKKEKIGEKA